MPKHRKALDWLSMAKEDLEEAFESFNNKSMLAQFFKQSSQHRRLLRL